MKTLKESIYRNIIIQRAYMGYISIAKKPYTSFDDFMDIEFDILKYYFKIYLEKFQGIQIQDDEEILNFKNLL